MEMMRPVFFIGCPRTGSKMYMNALNKFTNVNISHEIHYLHPKWLHKDFVRVVKNEIGEIESEKDVDKLIDLIRNRNGFFGTFWKKHKLNVYDFKTAILNSDLTFESIFKIILKEDAKSNNKERCGAKFPMHFSYLDTLYQWTPDCKIIHIIRDPRAIYASQLKKQLKKTSNPLEKILVRIETLLYILIIYKWDTSIQKKFNSHKNYHVSKYEEVINNFEKKMKQICDFIDVEYDVNMKNVPIRDSSYEESDKETGIVKSSLYKYKETLSRFELMIIKFFCRTEMKFRGYR